MRRGRSCLAGLAAAAALALLPLLPPLAAAQQPATAQPAATYAQRYADQCAACHGAQGVSALPLTPSLAGQPSFYAITQLFLFRDGRRDNPAMTAVAKGMTDADLRGYSELIGQLPPLPPPAASPADPQRLARGELLAKGLHCQGCHGADGAGGKQVPRLAQQREDYLQVALRGFRSGGRVGYTAAMSEALSGVTAEQIDDLAHYFAHLPPGRP